MNILITGGAGFIGSHLAKHYIDHGDSVCIIDNFITGNKRNIAQLDASKLILFEDDVCTFDYSQLPKMDIIYHLASPASPIQYKKHPIETMMANSVGTKNVFDFAKESGSGKIVIASTSEVYGDPLEHPQKETYYGNVNSFGERSCYDEAKRFAEALARSYIEKYNLDIRIIRIFNTYGPNMEINDGRVVSNFITQCLSKKLITIYG
ncbi:MAG TPA: NAD-dependent epimerase/dehydratase family protein, partial [Candidatus Woesebacteria bacterium]|nr:NAD-dependent epimerase/dehydratase family protein [Candidatus Woesebacteria bacterium]